MKQFRLLISRVLRSVLCASLVFGSAVSAGADPIPEPENADPVAVEAEEAGSDNIGPVTFEAEEAGIESVDPVAAEAEEAGSESTGLAAFETEEAGNGETGIDPGLPSHDDREIEMAQLEREQSALDLGYVPGELLVVYNSETADEEIAQTAETLNGEVQEIISAGESVVAVVAISEETTVDTAAAEYEADPAVAYAEPNYIIEVKYADSAVGGMDYLAAIQASGGEGAFAMLESMEIRPAVVGVIDTGFAGVSAAAPGKISAASVCITDSSGNYEAFAESGGTHGTNVAGILASAAGDALEEMVLVEAGSGSDGEYLTVNSVVGAISYLFHRVDIINMSIGMENSSAVLQEAVSNAYQNGVIMICAAGNEGPEITTWPSGYSGTISVMASDENGGRWASSGSGVIAAPGVNIICADGAVHDGTSLSAAMVSAAAAMLLSVSPGLSTVQLQEILISTADSAGGAPVLCMTEALAAAGVPLAVPDLSNAVINTDSIRNRTYWKDWPDAIELRYNDTLLQTGVDYRIVPESLQETPEGDRMLLSVDLAGIGDYSGTITVETDTGRMPIENCEYALSGSFNLADGVQICPHVTLTYENPDNLSQKRTLTEGTDYRLRYGKNNAAGEQAGSITVTGIGSYFGTKEIRFTIYAPEAVIQRYELGSITGTAYADGTLVLEGEGEIPDMEWNKTPFKTVTTPEGNTMMITRVVVGEGITSIGSNCFRNMPDLREVSLPESLEKIGSEAFSVCENLVLENLPANLKYVGDKAFSLCYQLSADLPSGLEWIGTGAFRWCAITNISIPEGVTVINDYAFYSCKQAVRIVIPRSVKKIGREALKNSCNQVFYEGTQEEWQEIEIESDALNSSVQIHYNNVDFLSGTCGENLTWVLDQEGTLTISGSGAMNNYTMGGKHWGNWIRKVIVEEGVTAIGAAAFAGYTDLSEIILPESLESIGQYAFYNCTGLESIQLPYGLGVIGSYAFYGSGLKEITLPVSVRCINNAVFCNCAALQSVQLPGCLTVINRMAFSDCDALTEISIPESVTSLGPGAFDACSSLVRVELSEGLKTIDSRAFASCSALQEVCIPGTVSSIGKSAFSGCSALTSMQLPEGLTEISDEAFAFCSALQEVRIPETVSSIGKSAFSGCSALTSMQLPEGLTEISDEAFAFCSALQEVRIQGTVSSIGKSAFSGCGSLEAVQLPEGLTVISDYAFLSCGALEEILIPENVSRVGQAAFQNCSSLSYVHFPEDFGSLGKGAFYSCRLTEVTLSVRAGVTEKNKTDYFDEDVTLLLDESDLPKCGETAYWEMVNISTLKIWGTGSIDAFDGEDYIWEEKAGSIRRLIISEGITGIGESAFEDFPILESVSLPDTLESIGSNAFAYCVGLNQVDIPQSVQVIGSKAFCACTGLKEVTVSQSVRVIGSKAFYACSSLEAVRLEPNNSDAAVFTYTHARLEQIQAGAFAWCEKMEDCDLFCSPALKTIEEQAFAHCTLMGCSLGSNQNIFSGNGVETIGDYAFYQCASLKIIDLMKASKIGKAAFGYCTGLTQFEVQGTLESLGDRAFIECINLQKYALHGSPVSRIGSYTFYNCKSLTNGMLIWSAVKTVGDYAFYGIGRAGRITLTDGLLSIGRFCFANCENLEEVVIKDSATQIGAYAFYNNPKLTKVTLPSGLTALPDGAFAYCPLLDHSGFPKDLELGSGVFAGSSDVLDFSKYSSIASTGLRLSAGTELGLYGYSDPDATVKSSDNAVLSILPHTSGSYRVRANAPGTAQIIYISSDKSVVARWVVTVQIPEDGDLEGLAKETGYGRLRCSHRYETRVIRKATTGQDGLEREVCRYCQAVRKTTVIPKASRVWLSATRYIYNGRSQKPALTVRGRDGKLISSSYYTVSRPSVSTKTGSYTVKVTFKGRYSGTRNLSYKIVKASNTFTSVTTQKTLRYNTLKKAKQAFTITAKVKDGAKKTFSLSSVSAKARPYITVSSSGKVTVKKGLPKGTYTLKVRISAGATANYKYTYVVKTIKIIVN